MNRTLMSRLLKLNIFKKYLNKILADSASKFKKLLHVIFIVLFYLEYIIELDSNAIELLT